MKEEGREREDERECVCLCVHVVPVWLGLPCVVPDSNAMRPRPSFTCTSPRPLICILSSTTHLAVHIAIHVGVVLALEMVSVRSSQLC